MNNSIDARASLFPETASLNRKVLVFNRNSACAAPRKGRRSGAVLLAPGGVLERAWSTLFFVFVGVDEMRMLSMGLLVLIIGVIGCGKSAKELQRKTGDLLRAISDTEKSYLEQKANIAKLSNLKIQLREIIDGLGVAEYSLETAIAKLESLRKEIYRQSDFENPTVDQIRHESLNFESLQSRLDSIRSECEKEVAAKMAENERANDPAFHKWGSIKGRVVISERPSPAMPLRKKNDYSAKDAEVCCTSDIPDESLVVDSTTLGIANAFVYLPSRPRTVNKKFMASLPKEVTLDQKGCRFVPHAITWNTDQLLRLKSGDDVFHKTKMQTIHPKNARLELPVSSAPVDRRGILLQPPESAEKQPRKIMCNTHSWMEAYVMITDHPYVTITKEDGSFELPDLPVGEHELSVWHEKIGKRIIKVNVETGKTIEIPTFTIPLPDFN